MRENSKNSIFVAVNRGEQEKYIEIPEKFKENVETFAFNAEENYLKPYGGIIILK